MSKASEEALGDAVLSARRTINVLERLIETATTALQGQGQSVTAYEVARLAASEAAVLALREALNKSTAALRPLTNAVHNDNGDMTVSGVSAGYDDCVRAYYTKKRNDAAIISTSEAARAIEARIRADERK